VNWSARMTVPPDRRVRAASQVEPAPGAAAVYDNVAAGRSYSSVGRTSCRGGGRSEGAITAGL
jgi:hypothetical protein